MSSQSLFGRSVNLLIGPNKQSGKLITDLRVTFKIEKNLQKFPNLAQIQVYNLSESSLGIITQKNSQILLSAGYGTSLKTIFRGTVAKVTPRKVGSDLVTEIEAGDGDAAFGGATVNTSFAPGSTAGQVVDFLKNALGLSAGAQSGVDESVNYPHGLTLSGMAHRALDTVLGKQDLEWSIQDEALQILPRGKDTGEEAVVLYTGWHKDNPVNTGVVGSPMDIKVLDPLFAKPKDGLTAQSGIQFMALLNGDIRPGRAVYVDAMHVQGRYRVYKVTFRGDTHALPWYAEGEAR